MVHGEEIIRFRNLDLTNGQTSTSNISILDTEACLHPISQPFMQSINLICMWIMT